MKKSKEKRVIPGFKLSLGITIALLSIVVLIPLASLILVSSGIGLKKFISIVTTPEVMAGYKVSFLCAFIAAMLNMIFHLRDF